MKVSVSFSCTDGYTSSNTSFDNYTATQASQEAKILIIGMFCIYKYVCMYVSIYLSVYLYKTTKIQFICVNEKDKT